MTTVPVTEKSTGSPDHGHPVKTVRTLTPVAAARALKVRRETVHRWMASGRLPVVVELNAEGRPVRRVPVEAIEEMVRDGVRDPSPATQAAQRAHAVTVTGSEPQDPALIERLVHPRRLTIRLEQFGVAGKQRRPVGRSGGHGEAVRERNGMSRTCRGPRPACARPVTCTRRARAHPERLPAGRASARGDLGDGRGPIAPDLWYHGGCAGPKKKAPLLRGIREVRPGRLELPRP